jgi:hypothetical protein
MHPEPEPGKKLELFWSAESQVGRAFMSAPSAIIFLDDCLRLSKLWQFGGRTGRLDD